MISVGLDITRLGLMLVQGQPKTAAEYIQATSRVGRDHNRPGLVVTILNLHKPRDRTHFEQFCQFHRTFYRAVEATSVTPWASRSLDRALAAVVVAIARHIDPTLTPESAARLLRDKPETRKKVRDAIVERAPDNAVVGGKEELVSKSMAFFRIGSRLPTIKARLAAALPMRPQTASSCICRLKRGWKIYPPRTVASPPVARCGMSNTTCT